MAADEVGDGPAGELNRQGRRARYGNRVPRRIGRGRITVITKQKAGGLQPASAVVMLKYPLIWLIRLYQVAISPVLPPSCRFHPTCSEYAREAVCSHGPARGALLAVKRILRCHPFNDGGYDPVPGSTDGTAGADSKKTLPGQVFE